MYKVYWIQLLFDGNSASCKGISAGKISTVVSNGLENLAAGQLVASILRGMLKRGNIEDHASNS